MPPSAPIAGVAAPAGGGTRRALAFVYAGYLLRYGYLLVLVPFYGRVLGADEYGRLLAAMSLMQVVWLLVEFGFAIVGARDTAAAGSRAEEARILGQQLAARLLLVPAGMAVGVIGTLLSPVLLAEPILGVLATFSGIVASFNLGWHFQGLHRFRTSVSLEVLGFAINLPLILLLVDGAGDAVLVMQILLFSGLVCSAVAYAVAIGRLGAASIRLHRPVTLIRGSMALFASNGLNLLMSSSATVLLSMFAPAQTVGWYGAAERLVTVALGLLQPAKQVLVATLSRLVTHPDGETRSWHVMRRSVLAINLFGLALMLGTWLVAGSVVPLILGPGFEPTIRLLRMLAVLFPLAAFCESMAGYVLIPLREDLHVSASSLVGAAATVALLAALVPFHAESGAVVARVIGYAAMACMLLGALYRRRLLRPLCAL
ncbi:oligosaccharide flippase family protein [Coralloluteibacterium stylophorae]|uniref:Oligosaccharide flippase family protein n=1 Tax=Coralloluteibacterium stylophorae TaxID=1776034 RepID=A0A8J7VWN3_9GAMM|nr:oligosaccharide flippase family protein [Coralloluteibacterium stylophorae]MBS7458544.1 oligosaccharide flippase family protein [Coralloluteibacterium stylophorae]